MRRRADGFRPVMEFLIGSAPLAFQAQGMRFVSLSGAPLACFEPGAAGTPVDRLLDAPGQVMEPVYGFRSPHVFKTRFNPRYEPMHLAYRDEGDPPRIGIALGTAFGLVQHTVTCGPPRRSA
jgi:phosphatidylglycerol lysyltransferase